MAKAAQRQVIEEMLAYKVSTALKDGKGKSELDCASSGWVRVLLADNFTD